MDDDEDKIEGCGAFLLGCPLVIVVGIICIGLSAIIVLGLIWSFVEVAAFLSEYGEGIFIFVVVTSGIVILIKMVVDWFR